MKRNIIFNTFFVLLWLLLTAEGMKFSHLTIKDGLSQSSVKCILQDSHGFLWIGTGDGLNKFDGYEFEKFASSPIVPSSLSGNDISCIYENPHDSALWIGTQNGGLNLYNRESNNFYSFSTPANPNLHLPSDFITDILSTGKTLWIATQQGGLFYFNETDSSFLQPTFCKQNEFSSISSLESDNEGNIWFGTPGGLFKWRYANKFNNDIPEKIIIPGIDQQLNIAALKIDVKGNIWIASQNLGLVRYHPKSENTAHFFPTKNSNSISSFRINDILERKNGEIWVATSNGLCQYLSDSKGFEVFMHDSRNSESINNNTIYSLLEDQSGIIWVGTYLGGLNKIDPLQTRFSKFNTLSELEQGNISNNDIRSITVNGDNTIWLGTSGGLIKIENSTVFPKVNDSSAKIFKSGEPIGAIVSYRDGIVFSTGTGILKKTYDNSYQSLSLLIRQQTGRNILRFSSGMVDELGQIWLGVSGGIIKYLPEQNKVSFYAPGEGGKNQEIFRPLSINEDHTGNIWIGTFQGELYSFDKYSNEFKLIIKPKRNDDLISFNKIFSVCTSVPNELWIGTNLGLYHYSIISGKIKRYLTEDGLPNNVIYAAIADDSGNIWCSTNLGVSKLNSKTGSFQNYNYQDGLQSNEFNQGAYYKDSEGKIYLGGINGLNIFSPDAIIPNSFIPKVVITAMDIQYERISPVSHPELLKKQISETRFLRLSHKQNNFSFDFTALSYSLPSLNQYRYALTAKGANDVWIDSGHRRRAAYTNISPGNYTFKVKGSNSDGIFNEVPTIIELQILPPIWQTWWFKLGALGLLLGMVYLISFLRFRNINQQKLILKKLVREKTGTLQKQTTKIESQNKELKKTNLSILAKSEKIKQKNKLLNDQHQKISKQRDRLLELAEKVDTSNQTKIRFFTSISHELRSPLTLIINPLKDLLQNTEIRQNKEIFRKINNVFSNASKLLLIVDQLLDFRKAETEHLKLSISNFKLAPFVQKSAFMFNEIASQKNIDFKFSAETLDQKIWADQDILEKIMINLLSNAIKATPNNGSIHIRVAAISISGNDYARISIKDTGIGIEKSDLPKIFERFFQSDEKTGLRHSGSGLGLALVKKYIELHHGNVSVESTLNEGSEFVVELPLGRDHFGDEVLNAQQKEKNRELIVSSIGNYLPGVTKKTELNSQNSNTVLLIEDDNDLRAYMSEMLSNQYKIIVSDTAKKGFQLAENKNPDIILSDVMLKDSDGFVLCKKLKSEFKTCHIPVILLTSLADNENHMNGIKSGADAYITKPFDLQHLLLKIENLIEGRRSLHKRFSLGEPSKIDEIVTNSNDQTFIKDAIRYVEENLKDTSFNVEQLCSLLKLSQPQCYRKIKAITGFNISEFIRNTRLKKASKLLQSGDYKINEVAYETGFNDANYFTKSFTKLFGITPSDYAKSF